MSTLEELQKQIKEFYKDKKYQQVIDLLTDEVLTQHKNALLYNVRGVALDDLKEYDRAITDYTKAIELKPESAVSYYYRANAWSSKEDYDNAILDYTKALKLSPNDAYYYCFRGDAWYSKGNYDNAISDYTKAIGLKPDDSYAYYKRGNSRRISGENLEESIRDFEKNIELTADKDDILAKWAKYYIEELRERIKDQGLAEIGDLTSKIKTLLLITEGCITHYTGLSVLRKLILDEDNLFQISEGSFLNDTSEGTELFNYLQYQPFNCKQDGILAAPFTPKPFIGSFVAESKHDDLNLWRFYGKEDGVEAQGCAITLKMKDFIEEINKSLTKDHEESNMKIKDDINFYRVAYWNHNKEKSNFHIPGAEKVEDGVNALMQELKEKVAEYKGEDRSVLEKYLNSIAFLIKSDAYKNENEIRLVIKGIGFDKKCRKELNPPRVYIELVNIRKLVKQITLGPKVPKPDEWASAMYYSYDAEPENRPEKILISRLPYK